LIGDVLNSCLIFYAESACCRDCKNTINDPPSTRTYNFADVNRAKRGDLVSYQGHVALIYCTPSDDPTGECAGLKEGEYKIIHAFGVDGYKDKNGVSHFTRKVIITPNQLVSGGGKNLIPAPLGFGRIKLWE
jgi:hypothetical protein